MYFIFFVHFSSRKKNIYTHTLPTQDGARRREDDIAFDVMCLLSAASYPRYILYYSKAGFGIKPPCALSLSLLLARKRASRGLKTFDLIFRLFHPGSHRSYLYARVSTEISPRLLGIAKMSSVHDIRAKSEREMARNIDTQKRGIIAYTAARALAL